MTDLIVLGFNDTPTLVGHFVLFPREREKRDRRGDERQGQGGRKMNENDGPDKPTRLIRACIVCKLHKGPFCVLHSIHNQERVFSNSALGQMVEAFTPLTRNCKWSD